ncbi:CPBP family intramembrane metalloprotease [bacterium]|nr:CPBP family intramembrane metalloprotease [bacterium]
MKNKTPVSNYLYLIILGLLVPASVFVGLKIFSSILITWILYYGVVCICIPIFDFLIIKKHNLKEFFSILGFKNIKKSILPSIFLGIVLFISIYGFFLLFRKSVIDPDKINNLLATWHLNKKYVFLFLFFMIFTNSFVEELWWRGYIYYKFNNGMSIIRAIIFSALFFSFHHFITTTKLFSIFYGIIFTIMIFISGIFWAFLRYKFKSIYITIFSHMLADFAIMVIYLKYLN